MSAIVTRGRTQLTLPETDTKLMQTTHIFAPAADLLSVDFFHFRLLECTSGTVIAESSVPRQESGWESYFYDKQHCYLW
jgi:hypothetical protein